MRAIIPIILVASTVFCSGLRAEPAVYIAGNVLEAIQLTDQHGKPGTIDEHTGLLIFVPDRDASAILHSALEHKAPGYLEQHRTTCLADISRMPSLVTRFFALPKMRKYSYTLLLARSAEEVAGLPRRKGQVTLIQLQGLRITGIGFSRSPEEIVTAIEGRDYGGAGPTLQNR